MFILKGVNDMQERKIRLKDMRQVGDFVKAAEKCDFDIDVFYNHVYVDGKSILGVLGLDLTRVLYVRYDGYNEEFEKILQKYAGSEGFAA
jgi:phosphocarrier protein HPr